MVNATLLTETTKHTSDHYGPKQNAIAKGVKFLPVFIISLSLAFTGCSTSTNEVSEKPSNSVENKNTEPAKTSLSEDELKESAVVFFESYTDDLFNGTNITEDDLLSIENDIEKVVSKEEFNTFMTSGVPNDFFSSLSEEKALKVNDIVEPKNNLAKYFDFTGVTINERAAFNASTVASLSYLGDLSALITLPVENIEIVDNKIEVKNNDLVYEVDGEVIPNDELNVDDNVAFVFVHNGEEWKLSGRTAVDLMNGVIEQN